MSTLLDVVAAGMVTAGVQDSRLRAPSHGRRAGGEDAAHAAVFQPRRRKNQDDEGDSGG